MNEKDKAKTPPAITIRRATVSDEEGIEKLEKASFGAVAWPRYIIDSYVEASVMDPEQVPLYVAFAKAANGDTEIAGYVIGSSGAKGMGMVLDLNVADKFKGRHLGRELLERVSDSLTKAGATELTLEVESTNKPAITLYESVGFTKDHLIPGYYGDKRDAYWMTKKVNKGPSA